MPGVVNQIDCDKLLPLYYYEIGTIAARSVPPVAASAGTADGDEEELERALASLSVDDGMDGDEASAGSDGTGAMPSWLWVVIAVLSALCLLAVVGGLYVRGERRKLRMERERRRLAREAKSLARRDDKRRKGRMENTRDGATGGDNGDCDGRGDAVAAATKKASFGIGSDSDDSELDRLFADKTGVSGGNGGGHCGGGKVSSAKDGAMAEATSPHPITTASTRPDNERRGVKKSTPMRGATTSTKRGTTKERNRSDAAAPARRRMSLSKSMRSVLIGELSDSSDLDSDSGSDSSSSSSGLELTDGPTPRKHVKGDRDIGRSAAKNKKGRNNQNQDPAKPTKTAVVPVPRKATRPTLGKVMSSFRGSYKGIPRNPTDNNAHTKAAERGTTRKKRVIKKVQNRSDAAVPTPPRRRRHHSPGSDESSSSAAAPAPRRRSGKLSSSSDDGHSSDSSLERPTKGKMVVGGGAAKLKAETVSSSTGGDQESRGHTNHHQDHDNSRSSGHGNHQAPHRNQDLHAHVTPRGGGTNRHSGQDNPQVRETTQTNDCLPHVEEDQRPALPKKGVGGAGPTSEFEDRDGKGGKRKSKSKSKRHSAEKISSDHNSRGRRRESRRERPSLAKLKSSLTSSLRRSGKRLSDTAASALEEPSEHATSGNASDPIKSQITPSSNKGSRPGAVAKSSSKRTLDGSDRGTNKGGDRGAFAEPSHQRALDCSERGSDKGGDLGAVAKPIHQRTLHGAVAGDGSDKRKKKSSSTKKHDKNDSTRKRRSTRGNEHANGTAKKSNTANLQDLPH